MRAPEIPSQGLSVVLAWLRLLVWPVLLEPHRAVPVGALWWRPIRLAGKQEPAAGAVLLLADVAAAAGGFHGLDSLQ